MANHLSDISVVTYLVVFAGGVATSVTPCVYPLIPIVAGVLGSGRAASRRRNFLLSFSYVLGMAVTFSILGMVAALTGRIFGQLQASPIAHLTVGVIIILFALVLLDVLPLPTFILYRAGAGKVRRAGSALPAFLMGLASGLVAAPCTVAVLGAVLTYVATTRNVIFGVTLLFTFAMGLGALLLCVGTFAGIMTNLPRWKRWMPVIQRIIALVMFLLGLYFIFKSLFALNLIYRFQENRSPP